ncbi:MAG: hypothetical protein K8S25_06840 [Alphaproteobacteria bacterium]|nr:hypothetical protein [Alphaproteobacteria bacterium]
MDYYKTKHERLTKEAIVKAQTVRVGLGRRLLLRIAVRRSLRTGGHSQSWGMRFFRLMFPEFSLNSRFRKEFGRSPGRFADDIAHYGLGHALEHKIDVFKEGKTDAPFMVVRSLLPTCELPTSYSARLRDAGFTSVRPKVEKEKWYLRDYYYDLIGSALLSALGTQHRSRTAKEEDTHRDYFTTPGAEIDQFSRDIDIPRRWRQAIPEFALVDEPAAMSGFVTARYAIYACIENPTRDPFWVLPVHYVVDALSDENRSLLRHLAYEFFDHWEDTLTGRGLSSIQKILGGEKIKLMPGQNEHYNKWMSFDANRIHVESGKTQQEERAAVGALRDAMQHVAASEAIPVMLDRGDVLIVDNYRVLIRRTELKYRTFNAWTWWRPPVRWLRMYCGFPPTPHAPGRASAASTGAALSGKSNGH